MRWTVCLLVVILAGCVDRAGPVDQAADLEEEPTTTLKLAGGSFQLLMSALRAQAGYSFEDTNCVALQADGGFTMLAGNVTVKWASRPGNSENYRLSVMVDPSPERPPKFAEPGSSPVTFEIGESIDVAREVFFGIHLPGDRSLAWEQPFEMTIEINYEGHEPRTYTSSCGP